MKVKLKCLGEDGQAREGEVEIDQSATVFDLRTAINASMNISANQMRLILNGKVLNNHSASLESLNISDGTWLHVAASSPDVQSSNGSDEASQSSDDNATPRFTGTTLQSHLTFLRRGIFEDPALVERVITETIRNPANFPEIIRNGVETEWVNPHTLVMRLPAEDDRTVLSPAFERVNHIEHGVFLLEHFRQIVEAENGLAAMVDRILSGSVNEGEDLNQLANAEARKLENPPSLPRSRYLAATANDIADPTERAQRFQQHPIGDCIVRHPLSSDLSSLMRSVFEQHDLLRPHSDRYLRILDSNMSFQENASILTDSRANVLAIYMQQTRQALHRVAYMLHFASDLYIEMDTPQPRRLFPQPTQLRVPPSIRSQFLIQLVDPADESSARVQTTMPVHGMQGTINNHGSTPNSNDGSPTRAGFPRGDNAANGAAPTVPPPDQPQPQRMVGMVPVPDGNHVGVMFRQVPIPTPAPAMPTINASGRQNIVHSNVHLDVMVLHLTEMARVAFNSQLAGVPGAAGTGDVYRDLFHVLMNGLAGNIPAATLRERTRQRIDAVLDEPQLFINNMLGVLQHLIDPVNNAPVQFLPTEPDQVLSRVRNIPEEAFSPGVNRALRNMFTQQGQDPSSLLNGPENMISRRTTPMISSPTGMPPSNPPTTSAASTTHPTPSAPAVEIRRTPSAPPATAPMVQANLPPFAGMAHPAWAVPPQPAAQPAPNGQPQRIPIWGHQIRQFPQTTAAHNIGGPGIPARLEQLRAREAARAERGTARAEAFSMGSTEAGNHHQFTRYLPLGQDMPMGPQPGLIPANAMNFQSMGERERFVGPSPVDSAGTNSHRPGRITTSTHYRNIIRDQPSPPRESPERLANETVPINQFGDIVFGTTPSVEDEQRLANLVRVRIRTLMAQAAMWRSGRAVGAPRETVRYLPQPRHGPPPTVHHMPRRAAMLHQHGGYIEMSLDIEHQGNPQIGDMLQAISGAIGNPARRAPRPEDLRTVHEAMMRNMANATRAHGHRGAPVPAHIIPPPYRPPPVPAAPPSTAVPTRAASPVPVARAAAPTATPTQVTSSPGPSTGTLRPHTSGGASPRHPKAKRRKMEVVPWEKIALDDVERQKAQIRASEPSEGYRMGGGGSPAATRDLSTGMSGISFDSQPQTPVAASRVSDPVEQMEIDNLD